MSVFDRFPQIMPEPMSGCWLWTGGINHGGYGSVTIERHTRNAHRAVYEAVKGPIPPGLDLDHKCRVRCCVNPDHLEPVTRRENLIRGVGPSILAQRGLVKTHCPAGHEYSPANTFTRPDKPGHRDCRECRRRRSQAWRASRREMTA